MNNNKEKNACKQQKKKEKIKKEIEESYKQGIKYYKEIEKTHE